MTSPKIVIVLTKCSFAKQSFGIRFEEKLSGQWVADWAFAIKESAAKREGYDRSKVAGTFGFDSAYPGCPFCKASGIFKCGCGKVACWDGEHRTVTCPWCGATSTITGQIESLSAGRDR
ncbi:MAG TPA: TerY-C metal binding domain-containing protein [Allocoleopsis sp.]